MMTIQEMKQQKKELGYTNEQLSSLSGVPLGTVMKIFGGATKAPRRATLLALEKVLSPLHSEGFGAYPEQKYRGGLPFDRTGLVKEQAAAYGTRLLPERMTQDHVDPEAITRPHRLYTVDDYYALPDDIRTELIDGVFYDMASPSVTHQLIIGELYLQFKACEKRHKGRCRVILSPCDVQLDQDRYTMLQPDILVVCDPHKINGLCCVGAPDLTVEILSPSSRSHDCVLKLNKYKKAGVREYWIVDPEHRQVIVYIFEGEGGPTFETYSFTDTVPIHISGGSCSVDLNEVLEGLT